MRGKFHRDARSSAVSATVHASKYNTRMMSSVSYDPGRGILLKCPGFALELSHEVISDFRIMLCGGEISP